VPHLREASLLLLIAALAVGSLVAFAALDRRSPNDHDTYFTGGSVPALHALLAPDADRGAVLTKHFLEGGPHPRLPQTVLLVASAGGASRLRYRLANLPFVLALVLGAWLLGRQLGGARVGLGAAALVCTLPLMLNHSHKFIPNWHAAALTPLAWALLLVALRGRGRTAWLAAAGAGVVQAARCYCHPVVLPDVALSTALVGGVALWEAARQRTREANVALVRVGAASGLAVLGTSHILGWTARWLGEPGYSLANYRAAKTDVVGRWSVEQATELIPAAGRYVSEMWSWHLFPTGFVLLALGLLAAAVAVRRAATLPVAVVLLATAFAVQAPVAVVTLARGTFTADWTVLLPGLCAVAAWGVLADESPLRSRLKHAWIGLLAVHALFVVLVPPVLGAVAPSPFVDPQWWAEGVPGWFARSSTGTVWNTHHIPLRGDVAGEPVARAIAEQNAAGLELVDLRLRDADLSVPCRPRSTAASAWVWGAGDEQTARREWGPWPSAFAGRTPITTDFGPADVLEAGAGREPTPSGPVVSYLAAQPRPRLVRLWVELNDGDRARLADCRPSWADDALTASAIAALGPLGAPLQLDVSDYGGELVGLENESDREPSYLGRALLLAPP